MTSDLLPADQNDTPDPTLADGSPADQRIARGASFFENDGAGAAGPSLDPAQESLANALNLTFRIVQLVMVLLAAAFLFSGVQTVGESERGIKLSFGAVTASDVQPGIRWNWPYPFGEIIRIRTSQQSIDLGYAFMPQLPAQDRARPWSQVITTKPRLDPAVDGSVVTADGALAHLECSVTFHHDDPVANATNIYAPDEMRLVRTAVERGVVAAVAQTPIDGLLRQSGEVADRQASLESRILSSAQAMLDTMDSGIRLDNVNVRDPRPPLAVTKEFDAVSRAEADAAKQREDAERASRLILNGVAGEAHAPLLERIDAYERAIELGATSDADAILGQIDSLFEGAPVKINGVVTEGLVGGDVTRILNDARQYRTDVVTKAQSRAAIFQAKLTQFRADPSVLVATAWSDAFREFLDHGLYETMLLPAGATGEFILTPDPDIPKQIEGERNLKQATKTIKGKIQYLEKTTRERTEKQARERRQRGSGG